MFRNCVTTLAALYSFGWNPAIAQNADANNSPAADPLAKVAPTPTAPVEPVCELHVWPTQNYVGINMGFLSGLGIVGALADQAAHKDRVQTVKDLMRDYLGPDIQLAELNRIGLLQSLKLPANYQIVIEEPTPFNEDAKSDPVLKARIKEMNQTIKANRRLSTSQSPCYAELITTMIFYHKAMMYGSNLFTNWTYRDFADQPIAQKVASGSVKNPLEVFPPKAPEQVEQARTELRDAYAKDFSEWVAKKHSIAAPPRLSR